MMPPVGVWIPSPACPVCGTLLVDGICPEYMAAVERLKFFGGRAPITEIGQIEYQYDTQVVLDHEQADMEYSR